MPINLDVKIPAVKNDVGQFDRNERYNTNLVVALVSGGRVKVGEYEFRLDDLQEAVEILKSHASRT